MCGKNQKKSVTSEISNQLYHWATVPVIRGIFMHDADFSYCIYVQYMSTCLIYILLKSFSISPQLYVKHHFYLFTPVFFIFFCHKKNRLKTNIHNYFDTIFIILNDKSDT